MERRLRQRVLRTLRAALRGTAVLALAAKFLVPVGFMPAALADGGPIRLCDAGPGAMAAHRPADPSPHGLQGHDGHEPTSVSLPDGAHDHDDPSANHHGWERCSLGGLASLAAIAGDWHFALPHVRPAHVALSDGAAADRRTVFAFRSRAPPLAHA